MILHIALEKFIALSVLNNMKREYLRELSELFKVTLDLFQVRD